MALKSHGNVALTTNERYIYCHFVHHYERKKTSPCFVPISPRKRYKIEHYLKALDKLEAKGLISIERVGPNYLDWIIKPPHN